MQLYEEIINTTRKILSWVIPSLFGFASELAYQSTKRPITWKKVLPACVIALFIGWLADGYLTANGHIKYRGYIVGVCAMASRNLIGVLMDLDWKDIIGSLADKLQSFSKKK